MCKLYRVPSSKLHKTCAKGLVIDPQLNVEYHILQGFHIRAGQNVRRLFPQCFPIQEIIRLVVRVDHGALLTSYKLEQGNR
jgi:hypothetical protein